MKRFVAEGMLLLVAVIWGTGFAIAQMAIDSGLQPLQILTLRFLISALIFGLILLPQTRRAPRRAWLASFGLGAVLFAAFALQTIGLQYTTPSKNALLTGVNVIVVPFLCRGLYKRRVRWFSYVSAFLCMAGIILLNAGDGSAFSAGIGLGDWLTILCAVAFALHIVLTGQLAEKYSSAVLTTGQFISAFACSAVLMLPLEGIPVLNLQGVGSVLYLGVLSTGLAFFLQTVAQKHTTQTRASLLLAMESVFGVVASILLVGDTLSAPMIAGCLTIVGAILLNELGSARSHA